MTFTRHCPALPLLGINSGSPATSRSARQAGRDAAPADVSSASKPLAGLTGIRRILLSGAFVSSPGSARILSAVMPGIEPRVRHCG